MTYALKPVITSKGQLRIEIDDGKSAYLRITPNTPKVESGEERAFDWKIRVRVDGTISVVKDTRYVGETFSMELGPTSTSRVIARAFLSTPFNDSRSQTVMACAMLVNDIRSEMKIEQNELGQS